MLDAPGNAPCGAACVALRDAVLDPDVRRLLDALPADQPDTWELGADGARSLMARPTDVGVPPAIDVATLDVTTAHGRVRARLYTPPAAIEGALAVFFHGGGWVGGSPAASDHRMRQLAVDSGVRVLAPEYRLAPEHRFPAAIDDCTAATLWAAESLRERFGSAACLGVAGESAGGNLAGAVAQRLNDRRDSPLRFQLLVYPVVSRQFDSASYQRWATGHVLTRATMEWFWECYVGSDRPRYADLLADATLAGLPPTTIMTCTHDPLCSEAEAYAAALSAASVPVVLQRYSGLIHGIWNHATTVPRARRFARDVAAALRHAVLDAADA